MDTIQKLGVKKEDRPALFQKAAGGNWTPKQLKEQIQPPPREERSKEGRGGKGLKLNPPDFVIIQVLILPKGLLTST